MNKLRILIFLLFCSTSFSCFSQERTIIDAPSIGVHLCLNDFYSKDSIKLPGKQNRMKTALALSFMQGINGHLNWKLTIAGSFANLPTGSDEGKDKQFLLQSTLSLVAKLRAGRPLFNPFGELGMGINTLNGNAGGSIPAGIGLLINIRHETSIALSSQYRYMIGNRFSSYVLYSIGFLGNIGHPKIKTAKKGISIPLKAKNNIADDHKDSDGDGIADRYDSCPLLPGLKSLHGCPIQDRDNDGIADALDSCPDLPGTKGNRGCPLISKTIQHTIEQEARNVFFETDSYVLKPSSFPALDNVATILQNDPSLKLTIEGHTDSTGIPEKNMRLSQQRANAVMEYLINKGAIFPARLSAFGYGSTRPVAGNEDAQGRAENRRVEFKIRYF